MCRHREAAVTSLQHCGVGGEGVVSGACPIDHLTGVSNEGSLEDQREQLLERLREDEERLKRDREATTSCTLVG